MLCPPCRARREECIKYRVQARHAVPAGCYICLTAIASCLQSGDARDLCYGQQGVVLQFAGRHALPACHARALMQVVKSKFVICQQRGHARHNGKP